MLRFLPFSQALLVWSKYPVKRRRSEIVNIFNLFSMLVTGASSLGRLNCENFGWIE